MSFGSPLAAATTIMGFRVWSLEVEDRTDLAPPGMTRVRVTAIVDDDRRPIHREAEYSDEMMAAMTDEDRALAVFTRAPTCRTPRLPHRSVS